MKIAVKSLDRVLAFLSFAFTVAFIVTVCIQIVCRTFPFFKIPSWTEEVSRYAFIYSVAFAAGLAVRANAYVAVDILTARIPGQFQRLFQIAMDVVLMAFCAFVEFKCIFKFAFLKVRMVSTALEIPMQYIYFSMVLLFGLLALCYLFEVCIKLTEKPKEAGAA